MNQTFQEGDRVQRFRNGRRDVGRVLRVGTGVSHICVTWDARAEGYREEWVSLDSLEHVEVPADPRTAESQAEQAEIDRDETLSGWLRDAAEGDPGELEESKYLLPREGEEA